MIIVKKGVGTYINTPLKIKRGAIGQLVAVVSRLMVMASLFSLGPLASYAQIDHGFNPVGSAAASQSRLKVDYVLYATMQSERDTAIKVTNKPKQAAGTVISVMERIHLVNTGKAALTNIWFYLYPNSYSSDHTALCEQLLHTGDLRLYFAKPHELGRLTDLEMVELSEKPGDPNRPVVLTDPTGTAERLRFTPAQPLKPGDSLTLQALFLVNLPKKLIDLGYKDGVSYLSHWFVQLDPSFNAQHAPARVFITTRSDQALYVDGDLRRLAKNSDTNLTGNTTTYDLRLAANATIAVKPVGSQAAIEPDVSWPDDQLGDHFASSHVVQGGEGFFKKLLPGPLAGKRPVRPDSVLRQMAAARIGAYKAASKPIQPAFLFNFKEADKKRYVSIGPAIGFNNYDKWMAGVLVHNYGLATSPFNFVLAPVYSTGDHTISGLGHLSYTKGHPRSAWQISLDGSSYAFNAYDSWQDAAAQVHQAGKMRLVRMVPAFRYKWSPDQNQPKKQWRLEAKAFILKKDGWVPGQLKMGSSTTTIGALRVGLRNSRALYPYQLRLQLQGTDQFLRAGLTGNYFLNYDATGKGLQLRGFAGKFFYLKEKNNLSAFNLGNYFFNLSGQTGVQDFTNSDYFVGRSEYKGWMSQQMTTSGGFFKVATPYLTDPIGQTDDWLAAINLTTDLPDGINPFSVLPFNLPVRAFLDMGTYSDLWSETPAAGRFLYDAGLQVSVLKEAVTIYFPLLYSRIYRDTYKSMADLGTYSKRIRFSISLGKLLPKRLQKEMQW